jgi:AraC-like DNA-binding protein
MDDPLLTIMEMKFRKPRHVAPRFPGQRVAVLPPSVVTSSLAKPITSNLIPTAAGFYPSAARHYCERPHGLSEAIIIYCVNGQGWARVWETEYVIGQDDVLIIPPQHNHAYGAFEQQPWTIYWCHATGTEVSSLLQVLDIQRTHHVLHVNRARDALALSQQLIGLLEAGYPRNSLVAASLILGHLLGTFLLNGHNSGTLGSDIDERIDETIEVMQESVHSTLSVAELAAMAKLSPSHYATVFKRKTGYAVLDYFIRLKMQEACKLLDASKLSVKEIAIRLGYDDPLYFSRCFRRIMAMSPRNYRSIRKG